MRTSVDIPDSLFKKLKTVVIEEETTIKDFLIRIIQKEIETPTKRDGSYKIDVPKIQIRSKGKLFKNKEIDQLRNELSI